MSRRRRWSTTIPLWAARSITSAGGGDEERAERKGRTAEREESHTVDSADDRIGKIRFHLIISRKELGLRFLIMVGRENVLLALRLLTCCRESEEHAIES